MAEIRNFSSSVEKYFTSERSERVKYFFNTRTILFISFSKHFISFHNEIPNHSTITVFWCERRDLLCRLSNGDIFTCEDNIPMLFSHVKISSFRAKAHVLFHYCLCNKQFHFTWYRDYQKRTTAEGSEQKKTCDNQKLSDPLLNRSLRACSLGGSGGGAGKGRRVRHCVFGIWMSASKTLMRNFHWRRWH